MPEALPHQSYIPSTEADIARMLAVVGVPSIDALYRDVPQDVLNPRLDLPGSMDEAALLAYMGHLASRNTIGLPSFLGYGAYRHSIPSIIARITGRDEYVTSYTPYQPEVSQGTLQVIFEFQSMMCNLTGMDVSNTGMLDEATALAEAALMASRIKGRRGIVAMDTMHPHSLDVVRNYGKGQQLSISTANPDQGVVLGEDTAALLVQYPNFLGYLEDLRELTELAHNNGSLMVVSVDNPTSLGILEPPGNFDADIVVGNGQGLGLPLNLGGANVGIFTAKEKYVRQMPGRIVGRATDVQGRVGYVLTLQTREQHIRRERATSNICTASALMALGVTIYLADYGQTGFEDLAKLNAKRAHTTARRIAEIPGYRLPLRKPFFNEFVVECPTSPTAINRTLLARDRIIGGLDISQKIPNGMLVCVTEMNTEEDIDRFVAALAKAV